MKKICLKKVPRNRYFQGHASYDLIYDDASGHKNRYHVYVRTSQDPVRIGCSLLLPDCRRVIMAFEEAADGFTGTREEALKIKGRQVI